MAVWSVRSGEFVRDGLNIYQVQELVRSGQVGPEDEASNGGAFKRVREIPPLARLLSSGEPAAIDPAGALTIAGMKLRVDRNGKPVPPTAVEIAIMLAKDGTETKWGSGERQNWRFKVFGAAGLGLLIEIVWVLAQSHRPQ